MELMKTNTDLRHKTREQDTHIQELKDKLSEQKRKMEYLVCAKKEMEENVHKMKVLSIFESTLFFSCDSMHCGM